jgi:hypothetical protein
MQFSDCKDYMKRSWLINQLLNIGGTHPLLLKILKNWKSQSIKAHLVLMYRPKMKVLMHKSDTVIGLKHFLITYICGLYEQ